MSKINLSEILNSHNTSKHEQYTETYKYIASVFHENVIKRTKNGKASGYINIRFTPNAYEMKKTYDWNCGNEIDKDTASKIKEIIYKQFDSLTIDTIINSHDGAGEYDTFEIKYSITDKSNSVSNRARLTYRNNWESDEYLVNGRKIKNLKSVFINGEEFKLTSNAVSIPYSDHGHTYAGTSTHYFINTEVKFGPATLTMPIDLNTIIVKNDFVCEVNLNDITYN